jgi:hypothetical protein
VEVEVLNAVAPYDPGSAADSLIVQQRVSRLGLEAIVECLGERGFPETLPPAEPIDRHATARTFNADFPDVDGLARDGLRVEVADGEMDGGEPPSEPPPGGEEAAAECFEEPAVQEAIAQEERFASVRDAWEDVLAEIEGTDEIVRLGDEFSACLRDEGVPAESATDAARYLAYVDGLMAQAGGDQAEMGSIAERFGKLYVECGRDLFEARERLRGGDYRDAFLLEHADALRKLSDVSYGSAGSGGL